MIIKRIKTKPFGGLSETEVSLKNGLNVIFGPNEAGKSTLFCAIQKGLFTLVNLSKPEFNKQILPFIPVGGDTATIEIEFSVKESNYLLEKSWGSAKTCKLTQSDGSVLTDDDAISSRLQELLPASEGTFNSTLLTYQSGLTYTISELSESNDTLNDLGDILRNSILNTDGISIDTFRQRVDDLEVEYLGRWDLIANRPEGGKGIENPWKNGMGLVIKSFYSLETIRQMLFRVKTFDDQYDEINKKIAIVREETRNRNDFLFKNEKAVNDARERRILIAEQNAISQEINQIKKINSDWPVSINKMADINNQLPTIEKYITQLKEELNIAKQFESNRNIIEKLQRVRSFKKLADESESELGKIKIIKREDLDIIRTAIKDIEIIEGSLAAGKLAVKIQTSKELSIQVKTDLNDALSTTLLPSKPIHFEAKGRILINHPDMAIEVSSGEGNFEQIAKQHMDAMNRFNALLQQYQVSSIEDAIKINAEYELHLNAFTQSKSNLESELGEDTIDALEDRIKSLPSTTSDRNLLSIGIDLTKKENELKEYIAEKDRHQNQIKEYEHIYHTPDDLMLKLAELISKSKLFDQKLKSLTPLPPEVTDVEQFIELFETENVLLDKNKNDLSSLDLQRATLEGQAPDSTSEELQIQFNQTEKVFSSLLKKANGIACLKEKLDALSGQIDTGTYSGLEGQISQYLSEMTNGKYSNIAMNESLPDGFIRSDGKTIRIDLLSTGTKDILGLAVRLAMSKYFLQGSDGFIAMDDPLVDLDPGRQQKSAEVLKAFARDKQLIIFTCHPSHVALLGGNNVTLN